MTPDPALDAAYRATTYRVRLDGLVLDLRVGQGCPDLDAWLKERGESRWVVLTAWNPASRPCPAAWNRAANQELHDLLLSRGHACWPTEHHADGADWEVEEGFFVLGPGLAEAGKLAEKFGQNAFVYGVLQQFPQLQWTRGRVL